MTSAPKCPSSLTPETFQRFVQADEAVWSQFYTDYATAVRVWILARRREDRLDPDVLEELVDDVFVRLFRQVTARPEAFENPARVIAYFKTIPMSVVADWYRRQRMEHLTTHESTDDPIARHADQLALREELQALLGDDYLPLMLRIGYGYSVEEVCILCGLPDAKAFTALRRSHKYRKGVL